MRALLDTHALLWFLAGSDQLPGAIRSIIEDPANEIFVSAVSAMEVTTKVRLGKLSTAEKLAIRFEQTIAEKGFGPLAITLTHAQVAGLLPMARRDPFDRMLIAQAQVEGMTLLSNETIFDETGVSRLW